MGHVLLADGTPVDAWPTDTHVVIGYLIDATLGCGATASTTQATIDAMAEAGYVNIRVAPIRTDGTVDEDGAVWIASADTP